MAGIQEVDKVRSIFDATVLGVNDNIRANTDKKTTAPTLYDLLFAKLHLLEKNLTLFKSDVSKARRRIKVLKKHWKYMVAKIKDKFWVNKVGTYGVASAQLYWGRLAAVLTRLSYHISEIFLWVLVFVDDFMALMPDQQGDIGAATLMLFLTLVGCPISWHKNVLGKKNRWLGYMVDISNGSDVRPPWRLEAGQRHEAPELLRDEDETPVFLQRNRTPEERWQLHVAGQCLPCLFHVRKEDGCRKGDQCLHCHFCTAKQVSQRRRRLHLAARRRRREGRQEQEEEVEEAEAEPVELNSGGSFWL
eukprot:s3382_g8.t1